jgi:hypothetical protein
MITTILPSRSLRRCTTLIELFSLLWAVKIIPDLAVDLFVGLL